MPGGAHKGSGRAESCRGLNALWSLVCNCQHRLTAMTQILTLDVTRGSSANQGVLCYLPSM